MWIGQQEQLAKIAAMARQEGVTAFLVGGALRDVILERPHTDFDFVLMTQAMDFAQKVAYDLKAAYIPLDPVHGCARVAKKAQGQLMTFDFADCRAESLEQDLVLRDFTINSCAIDFAHWPYSKESFSQTLMDGYGGRMDMAQGIIRMTSAGVFDDDPLRMLRAFSLRAQLGFSIEPDTLGAIAQQCDAIRQVSAERIAAELFKILSVEQSSSVLREMDRVGLLAKILPQIRLMDGCTQGGYHHLDVWEHSLEAVTQFEILLKADRQDRHLRMYWQECLGGGRARYALVKLAVLLHDIGKPDTRQKKEGGFSFHAHEHVGARIVKYMMRQLKLSARECRAVEDMVRWHLRPGYLSNEDEPTPRALYRYFRDTQEEAVSIAMLSLADQRATRGPLTTIHDQEHHEKICWQLAREYFYKKEHSPFSPLINGHDLMKELQIEPSALMGKILKEVAERQALGEITTKTEALDCVRLLKKQEECHED